MDSRFTTIYRSSKEEGLYLYVDKIDDLSRVPETLLQRFGRPELAMHLLLGPTRKLARPSLAPAPATALVRLRRWIATRRFHRLRRKTPARGASTSSAAWLTFSTAATLPGRRRLAESRGEPASFADGLLACEPSREAERSERWGGREAGPRAWNPSQGFHIRIALRTACIRRDETPECVASKLRSSHRCPSCERD